MNYSSPSYSGLNVLLALREPWEHAEEDTFISSDSQGGRDSVKKLLATPSRPISIPQLLATEVLLPK